MYITYILYKFFWQYSFFDNTHLFWQTKWKKLAKVLFRSCFRLILFGNTIFVRQMYSPCLPILYIRLTKMRIFFSFLKNFFLQFSSALNKVKKNTQTDIKCPRLSFKLQQNMVNIVHFFTLDELFKTCWKNYGQKFLDFLPKIYLKGPWIFFCGHFWRYKVPNGYTKIAYNLGVKN